MWLSGVMRRMAQDVGAFAPIHAGIGLSQWRRSGAAAPDDGPPAPEVAPCEIADFEPGSDALVCIWDDSVQDQPAPQVQLEADPDHEGWLRIRLGASIVAKVRGKAALSTADLAVMPLSSAQALGLAPADGAALQ